MLIKNVSIRQKVISRKKRNALETPWKKRWLLIWGRSRWRGDGSGQRWGWLGDNRGDNLLTGLGE